MITYLAEVAGRIGRLDAGFREVGPVELKGPSGAVNLLARSFPG